MKLQFVQKITLSSKIFEIIFVVIVLVNRALCGCSQNSIFSNENLSWQTRILDRYLEFEPVSLVRCVKECMVRKSCKSFNYSKRVNFCELSYLEKEEGKQDKSNLHVGFVHGDIRHFDKNLAGRCRNITCPENSKCNMKTGSCEVSDCGREPKIQNAIPYGYGHHEIGNGVLYHCLQNYEMVDSDGESIEEGPLKCKPNGEWEIITFTCLRTYNYDSTTNVGSTFYDDTSVSTLMGLKTDSATSARTTDNDDFSTIVGSTPYDDTSVSKSMELTTDSATSARTTDKSDSTTEDSVSKGCPDVIYLPNFQDISAFPQYRVTMTTGSRQHAGTNARVFLIIYGSKGNTHLLQIKDTSKSHCNLFEKGSTDTFIFRNIDVGEMNKISIYRDNTGKHPGWFLASVHISKNGGSIIEFKVNRWIKEHAYVTHKSKQTTNG